MKQTIICKECKEKYLIEYPNDIVWEEGKIKCKCGLLIEFKNICLETLYL